MTTIYALAEALLLGLMVGIVVYAVKEGRKEDAAVEQMRRDLHKLRMMGRAVQREIARRSGP